MATTQYNFNINRQDLDFILKQIKIAEVSTLPDGSVERATLLAQIGGPGAAVNSAALLPYGLRTVDGTWNNLLPGQERFGAADNIMPRLTALNLDPADPIPAGFPGAGAPTSYASTSGFVFDAQPRLVSNLIVDQTAGNPAAVQVAAELAANGVLGVLPTFANGSLSIPNESPDIGLSPPFNGWMTIFGQFFDHGLDLIGKGGSGTVFVPLQPDDPLFVPGSPTNFMVLTRATNAAGPDGIIRDNPATAVDESADSGHLNSTTPYVDQNQTYTSHPSHQVFLREYVRVADNTVDRVLGNFDANGNPIFDADTGTALDVAATGRLLTHTVAGVGVTGEGTWADVKAQAASMLGIQLVDQDVFNVPLLATDRYGEFIRGPNGFAQIVTTTGLVEGNPAAPVLLPANTIRTGHAFLDDIAHNAAPGTFDHDGNPATPQINKTPDLDTTPGAPNPAFNPALPVGGVNMPFLPQPAGTYDNETLDRHFITGDGRGNENIALTAVHTIFHSEHNRTVDANKATILASGDLAFINEWMRTPITAAQAAANVNLPWDGERLFQAARFTTEMQYQHMVFEEFGRAVSPTIDPFIFSNSSDIDPAIFAEFANVVYRFGHSMLTETVDRTNMNMTTDDIGLIQAFLNPLEFNKSVGAAGTETIPEDVAVGAIVRGMTRQVGNAIDEFVTEALRNNLVGLPLDLAVLNMARARDTGTPSFNEARAQFYAMTGDAQLQPFSSWADMAPDLKHSASIVNFIAAYGTHPSITAIPDADGKRAAALLLVMGGVGAPADRADFLNSTGTWATTETGLNKVDFWIGGLAERVNEFAGMLGPTFNFVFEQQLENLQNGDRFYYLSRTQGTNMLNELENNTFSKLIMRNSDLGAAGSSHLPSLVFTTPNWVLEVNQAAQLNLALANGPGRDGILVDDPLTAVNEAADNTTSNSDPFGDDPILEAINPMVQRGANFLKFSGGEHVVLGGSPGADTLLGGTGIDSLWGDAGNDRLDGGDEADQVHGGDGDDIITDHGTPAGGADFLHGDNGNDVIAAGTGNDLLFGGMGNDFIIMGNDFSEVFSGEGNDFALGGNGPDFLFGNEGDDWLEGGEGFDGLAGENSELFFNSPIIGHDVLNGQGNDTDYDGESGNDIMVQGPGIQRSNGMLGFDWAIHKGDPVAADTDLAIPFFPAQTVFTLRDRFDSVEALSGWRFNDHLVGTSSPTGAVGPAGGIFGAPATDSMLQQKHVGLVNGLQNLLGVLPVGNPEAIVFNPQLGADILIGGAGSDLFEAKAGNDLIDGDAWMNIRIAISPGANPGAPTSAESMNDIKALMIAGTINPGQLSIVREIVRTGANPVTDTDVAVYNGPRADYTITGLNGVPGLRDAFGQRIVRITDNVVAPVIIDGVVVPLLDDEGTDTLRGVEFARFITRDAAGVITNVEDVLISSRPPTGTAAVTEDTPVNTTSNLRSGVPVSPTQGQVLSATLSPINDPDSVTALNPTGLIDPASIARVWQSSTDGGATWVDIATANTFTPGAAQVGALLRVDARFIDGAGFDESIASEPTLVVGSTITVAAFPVAPANLNAGDDVVTGTAAANTLRGGDGWDILNGLAGADVLDGGTGNDVLNGGIGNDSLDGGLGADTMAGEADNDSYNVDDVGDVVVEAAANGTDTLRTSLASYALNDGTGVGVDNLTYTDATFAAPGAGSFNGTGNAIANVITGGTGADSLSGLGGNDTLNGGAGADAMNGGDGNDTFVVDNAGDVVTEGAGGASGTDLVQTTLNAYTLTANVENLTYTGAGTFAGTGNAQNNTITGGAGVDTLNGLGGDDQLIGLGGADILTGGDNNDTLNGGLGNDTMTGGAGNDTYVVGQAGDVVTEAAGGGTDTVQVQVATLATYTLGANVENLTFVGGVAGPATFTGNGNALSNVLIGGLEDDDFTGAGAADTMTGGGGSDWFIYNVIADSGVGAARDIITDFLGGADVLQSDELRMGNVDANGTVAGNQAFTFIGNAAFSDTTAGAVLAAGQVRFELFDADLNGSLESTLVQFNVNDNLAADMEILLRNYTGGLVAADFLL
jgi:Ca2+-binding RTX toxin-like protein